MPTEASDSIEVCKACGFSGIGNYCNHCGQVYHIKRITFSTLLHDIFHFFTHLDKGFGYTVKMLIIAPGHMQREYIEGERSKHQKPFSMFFICATIAAVSRYWIYQALIKYYHSGNISEVNFFHEYMVIFQTAFLPLHGLVVFLLFNKSGYNYAEIGVLVLYSISFFFLIATLVALFKFFWPHLDTAYIELPVLLIYNAISFINFFHKQPPWIVALKSTIFILGIFLLIQVTEDFIIQLIS
ncbi:MAG: DUF3667 domain-containing protein [Ginsengibacter sp.]